MSYDLVVRKDNSNVAIRPAAGTGVSRQLRGDDHWDIFLSYAPDAEPFAQWLTGAAVRGAVKRGKTPVRIVRVDSGVSALSALQYSEIFERVLSRGGRVPTWVVPIITPGYKTGVPQKEQVLSLEAATEEHPVTKKRTCLPVKVLSEADHRECSLALVHGLGTLDLGGHFDLGPDYIPVDPTAYELHREWEKRTAEDVVFWWFWSAVTGERFKSPPSNPFANRG